MKCPVCSKQTTELKEWKGAEMCPECHAEMLHFDEGHAKSGLTHEEYYAEQQRRMLLARMRRSMENA